MPALFAWFGGWQTMKRTLAAFGLAAVAGLVSSSAFAFTIGQSKPFEAPSPVVQARVVCDEAGVCVRPPVARPTARWIYGDRSFYGPYDGPRYYGNPNRRYGWWIFGLW
jgi:hypothetical protein